MEIDLNSHAYLEVINEVGKLEVNFKLKIKEEPINDAIDPAPSGIGIDPGVIIGISLAVLIFIAVLVGFTVWYCKSHQFLCFAQEG